MLTSLIIFTQSVRDLVPCCILVYYLQCVLLDLLSLGWEPRLRRQIMSALRCLSGGKKEGYQNCSLLYCVLKLCTVISTLR